MKIMEKSIYSVAYKDKSNGRLRLNHAVGIDVGEAFCTILEALRSTGRNTSDFEIVDFVSSPVSVLVSPPKKEKVKVKDQDYKAEVVQPRNKSSEVKNGIEVFTNNMKLLLDKTKATKEEREIMNRLIKRMKLEKKTD